MTLTSNFPQSQVTAAGYNPKLGGAGFDGTFGTIGDPRLSASPDGGQNLLFFELYYFNAATLGSKNLAATKIATCDYCIYLSTGCDVGGVCDRDFLAQAGAVNVIRADKSVDAGRFTASLTNLRFVEWNFGSGVSGDKPVPGGACYMVTTSNLDVSWIGRSDGGTRPFQGDGGAP